MTDALTLYGTDAPVAMSEQFTLGDVSFTLEDGGIRHLGVNGIELIRGLSCPVRDSNWGTLVPELREVSRRQHDNRLELVLNAVYRITKAQLDLTLTLDVGPGRLSLAAHGTVSAPFETNRAGFTVLHAADLAGSPVTVTHANGKTRQSEFPVLIDPWQPFQSIAALSHQDRGLMVTCTFEGDTFEMEDQRQWGDASYKTYVRPLAHPWPYLLTPDAPLSQSVTVTWREADTAEPARAADPVLSGVTFPDTAILVTASDAARLAEAPGDLGRIAPQRLLCHVDTSVHAPAQQVSAFARLQASLPDVLYDLELVCGFDKAPATELAAVRQIVDAAGFRPDSVLVCPAVDRQSTPPGSDWPDCPPLEDIHTASAKVFADLSRGGGMVTFFPELNRKRPPLDGLDFVSHALCPIIHAADDVSVMETLEAISHITRTARSFIDKCAYRIGPSTLAMRHNPYGQKTLDNPGLTRMCMSHDDPRHRGRFGAAYTIGLACALAPAGVSVWTPSEMYGPRGLVDPLAQAIAMLARLAGQPVEQAQIRDGLGHLRAGGTDIRVNLTPTPKAGLGPFDWSCSG